MRISRLSAAVVALSLLLGGCAVANRELLQRTPVERFNQSWAQAGLSPITEMPSPNVNERPDGTPISCIVLHHTQRYESAEATARYFQSPASQVSAHYIVDRDGSIIRCVPDGQRAWHAGVSRFRGVDNVNDFSIGIEICNRGDNIEPYPEAQLQSVIRLVGLLARTYDVPIANVTRHRDIALPLGRRTDPSDNFDYARVLAEAQALIDRLASTD